MGWRTLSSTAGLLFLLAAWVPSRSKATPAKPLTFHGVNMSETAYEAVCWFETIRAPEVPVNGKCAGEGRTQAEGKNEEEWVWKWFANGMRDYAMPLLPKEYGSACNKYLKDANLKPSSDESDALNDSRPREDYVFKGYAYCLMSVLRQRRGQEAIDIIKNERTHYDLNSRRTFHGVNMSETAYEAACWYETIRVFPDTIKEAPAGEKCRWAARVQASGKNDDEWVWEWFSGGMKKFAMPRLPQEYRSACNKYLDNSNLKPGSDESDALNDSRSGENYAFKGYAYCIMSVLRQRRGQEAIDIVKSERTHQVKDWRLAAMDKENELRARHGVNPFTLNEKLNEAAQIWAERLAKDCVGYHYHPDLHGEPDDVHHLNGKGMGENLYATSVDRIGDVDSVAFVNGWYREIKYYPYPKSCDEVSCSRESLGMVVLHFTQQVWKESNQVGYGIASNPNCPKEKTHFVARYFPMGNWEGAYKDNVLPPLKRFPVENFPFEY